MGRFSRTVVVCAAVLSEERVASSEETPLTTPEAARMVGQMVYIARLAENLLVGDEVTIKAVDLKAGPVVGHDGKEILLMIRRWSKTRPTYSMRLRSSRAQHPLRSAAFAACSNCPRMGCTPIRATH